jgi:uncharacterized RDD family membrane protein YckC
VVVAGKIRPQQQARITAMSTQRLQDVRLRTPEGVAFSFRLATPLLRLLAMLVDNACVAAAWSAVSVLFSLLNVVSGDVAAAAAIVGYFVLSNGYTIATEWRWQGQTFGKRILRLRVVDERGLPLSFSQVAIRNLLRFIDSLPAAYAVGGVVALLNTRGQRLGDIAAGTLVIWEPPVEAPDLSALRFAVTRLSSLGCGMPWPPLRRVSHGRRLHVATNSNPAPASIFLPNSPRCCVQKRGYPRNCWMASPTNSLYAMLWTFSTSAGRKRSNQLCCRVANTGAPPRYIRNGSSTNTSGRPGER